MFVRYKAPESYRQGAIARSWRHGPGAQVLRLIRRVEPGPLVPQRRLQLSDLFALLLVDPQEVVGVSHDLGQLGVPEPIASLRARGDIAGNVRLFLRTCR